MSIFSGMLSQLSSYVVYALIALGAVFVAFTQMLYTVFQTDCENAISTSTVCSVRDSYRIVYLLLRGEVFVDVTGSTQMSSQAATMIAAFLFSLFVVAVGLFAIIILVTGQADLDELARRCYWEPIMAYVLSMNTLGVCGNEKRRTCGDFMSDKLSVAWDVLTLHFTGGGGLSTKSKTWLVSPIFTAPLAVLSFIIIPIWILVGALTLGFLWPPQIRRVLFRPNTLWQSRRAILRSSETTTQQIHALRSETVKFKVLSYDRMMGMEKQMRELNDLVRAALKGGNVS